MALSAEQTTRLLGAIETDSLVFLCGAGLSTGSPSNLPLAAKVAEICYDAWLSVEELPPAMRNDRLIPCRYAVVAASMWLCHCSICAKVDVEHSQRTARTDRVGHSENSHSVPLILKLCPRSC